MDFVRRFEDHQVERIRRAIIAYRSKHSQGDVLLTKDLLEYLPKNVTYESTLKNVQRLRKGERMRGAAFLNACVQFLEVEMATPPEEELGLAMQHFVGKVFGYDELWKELEGDFALHVLGERDLRFAEPISQVNMPVAMVAAAPIKARFQPRQSFVTLSIRPGEGLDYGVARERYFFRNDGSVNEAKILAVNALERKGVCLPVGKQDMLVMMRDFLFSHMYVLRRETYGFSGTMIMPSAYEFLATEIPSGVRQSQYDVALHRVPQE